jgi:hypothetical protein
MLSEVGAWLAERVRKGAEFEIEGALIKAVAEYAPHTIASAIGCAIVKAQVGIAISGVTIICVVVIVRHRMKHHEQASEQGATEPQCAEALPPVDRGMGVRGGGKAGARDESTAQDGEAGR